jgi:Ser/Thr protein kinase RdoA (MazF antagonist)
MNTPGIPPPRRAAEAFELGGRVLDVQALGRGLINDTFVVSTTRGRAVLQRINRGAFPQPELIMQNLRVLLEHAAGRAARTALRLPSILRTRDGRDYFIDDAGEFWRALDFIEHTRSLDRIDNAAQARAVGGALGSFHALVHDLDPARLHATRSRFHDTPWYYERFQRAREQATLDGADETLTYCLDFAQARAARVATLEEAKARGALRSRVVHGDPKLDNVLFDAENDVAVSLIDLDTVQAGLPHYDVGDCLRSACNPVGETPRDPAQARFDLDICRGVLGAYLDATRGLLTEQDIRYLPEAVRLIAFELGLRFLTDHLQGDRYFKVEWRGHNLHRAQTQFVLTESIEIQREAIGALIEEHTRG